MTKKRKGLKVVSAIFALAAFILAIGATVTFAKFSGNYVKDEEHVKIADAVAGIVVDSVYRTSQDGNRISVAVDKKADTVTIYDVEPEDDIEYYFTVSGIDGQRVNEVTMNVTLNISVQLETIATDGSGKHTDYFGGWTVYDESDGIKDKAYLRVYHGGESDSSKDIRPSATGSTEVDFTGNILSIITNDGKTINKTGLVMGSDDGKKEYSYHLIFTLPRQNAEKENYAGARVFFEIQAVAEQAKQK